MEKRLGGGGDHGGGMSWGPGPGVATGWTEVDMSTPLLPETIPEIDADPASFLGWG